MNHHLFLHCRAGFEKECAAEITELAAGHNINGYAKTSDNQAYVLFIINSAADGITLLEKLPFTKVCFTRQWFVGLHQATELLVTDRVSSILAIAEQLPAVNEVFVETFDTNDGKELSTLARKLNGPILGALQKTANWQSNALYRLHVVLINGTSAWIGVSLRDNSSEWPMGIPRLRLAHAAPSRSALKLEEAWHLFIPDKERTRRLSAKHRAVDLGAAPGGWSWQLTQLGMHVIAVDNGPLQAALLESGKVIHIRHDAFRFQPEKPVHWLVCDMVEQPNRVAELMAQWFVNQWCQEAIFNLKLPMKKRYLALQDALERIHRITRTARLRLEINYKQLYHDREEVTVYARY
ncbi:MAG: 23S rRNA (cytidine(2498)-2'-O)-methyltransferase RlmM [Gammaproteobacteria bacterium]|nr:23S rRNA (cytidine(2498)-2'-O)-methyltransferase RlmM [Gammaproteobacteria bacterium]